MVRRWRLIGYFPILYNPPLRGRAALLVQDDEVCGGELRRLIAEGDLVDHRKVPCPPSLGPTPLDTAPRRSHHHGGTPWSEPAALRVGPLPPCELSVS
jgi:hypothetical protein